MPDYKEMYVTLFREMTKAITILQEAQQKNRGNLYSDDPSDNLTLIKSNDEIEDRP